MVGGGSIGTRKVMTLLKAGADVTVVSPAITAALEAEVDAGRVHWIKGEYEADHLKGAFLVVAAASDGAVNSSVAGQAVQGGVLVCDASSADRSELIFGALLEAGEVTAAFFSDGRDPALARRARDEVASFWSAKGTR